MGKNIYSLERQELIIDEIKLWSETIIEEASPLFGGLPPCPYARKAWLEGRVFVCVTPDLDDIIEVKAVHRPKRGTMYIVAWTGCNRMSPSEFNDWVYEQNKNHFNIWITGFHPDSDEDPMISEFDGISTDDYAIIIMQSYPELIEASEKLRQTKYYENLPDEDMKYIKERKELYDAWNEKVDAKAQENREEISRWHREKGNEYIH